MAAISVEAKIVDGLIAHFNGITLPTGVTVAYPGINFVPPVGKAYVRLTIQKNTSLNAHIGGGVEPIRRGIFMALVRWPICEGIVKPSELAATIRDRFAYGTRISTGGIVIRIIEEPTVQGDDQGDVFCELPVIVPWQVYP